MGFKESVEKDLDTFANPDEFAEAHLVRGQSITCVIQTDSRSQRDGGDEFGIDELSFTLYAKISDLKENGIYRSGYGSHLNVDGRICTVMSWTENMGMASISLSVPQDS